MSSVQNRQLEVFLKSQAMQNLPNGSIILFIKTKLEGEDYARAIEIMFKIMVGTLLNSITDESLISENTTVEELLEQLQLLLQNDQTGQYLNSLVQGVDNGAQLIISQHNL